MLILVCRDLTGGIRKHIVSIIKSFKPQELKIVTHLSLADPSFQKFLIGHPEYRDYIVDIEIKRSPHPKDLLSIWKVRNELKALPAGSIIHGHGAKGGLIARLLSLMLGYPCIYTPHGGSVHPMFSGLKNLIYSLVEKLLYPFTDRLVFESQYSLETYAKRIHKKSDKFILNYNGVAISSLPIQTKEKPPYVIGAFGALRPLKGFDILIRAASTLKDKGHELELRIYGEGSEKEKLSASGVAKLMGETSDVESAMRECDIIVQPSRFESFGLTACEAMSMGVPVVASNAGGLPEVIEDKVTGLLFESGNSDDLADKLASLLDSFQMRESFSKNGQKRVIHLFSEEKMQKNLTAVYQELGLEN